MLLKQRIQIYLAAKQAERLKKAAKKAKMSMSELVRQMVEEGLKVKK